jgi:outer membrane protein assembly factor BamA
LNCTKSKYFPVILAIGLLQSCIGIKHLKQDEKLLYRQYIEAPKKISSSDLENLEAIKTNTKFLRLPIHTLVPLYYTGLRHYHPEKFKKKRDKKIAQLDAKIAKTKSDKKINNLQFKKQQKNTKFTNRIEEGNLFMQWGEPVTLYDSAKLQETVNRFKSYLFAHGYFLNEIRIETIPHDSLAFQKRKRVSIRYIILPGTPYRIDSIHLLVRDSTVLALLQRTSGSSHLRPGTQYNQDNFVKERERIDALLKDEGYYDFSRQYIEYEVDTVLLQGQRVAVKIIINDPAKRGYHKRFVIDEVHITPDAGISQEDADRTSETFRNRMFHYFERNYNLKILSQRIFITPGQTFSRSTTFSSQRQLANLDVFKFVNINYDTADGRFIANVFASPFDRYQWSNEVGLSVTQGFPGPYYNLNFKKRNIFRGLENFEMNGRIGYEGVAAATELGGVYQSVDAGINASITFPQFILPLKEETRYRLGRLNPRTKAQVGYNYTDRPEYQRSAVTFNYLYSWENKRTRKFDLTLASLSIINSNTRPDFQDLLDSLYETEGNTLKYSFDPSFVSSAIFAMSWNHNNYGNLEENSVYFRWAIDAGGIFQDLYTLPMVERNSLETFQYVRLSADVRRINVLNPKTTIAFRFNVGVGYSYGGNQALPYEKYFFAGGSNSVRAWRPRRLGPGSYRPEESADPEADGLFSYQFEQPGEVLIENSVEVRRKLVGFVEGAVFLDVGNVWTFKPRVKLDENENVVENGNSQFKFTEFYKEFGVGTGFGLRFNFSFLILRFDVGLKIYDPARVEGDRYVFNKLKFFSPFGTEREPVIYNVGVGFPF